MAGESVLIVEDTELLRRIYADKLSQEGYKVFQAVDGLECLNAARTEQLDLIVLDLVMPRMSGLDALEALKRDPRSRDVPVIVLSNLGQETDIQRCLHLGAVDYLIKNSSKPVDVAAKIRSTLDGQAETAGIPASFRLQVKDLAADADAFVAQAGLNHRFWCPSCEVELALELIPEAERRGWYQAHLLCPNCGKDL